MPSGDEAVELGSDDAASSSGPNGNTGSSTVFESGEAPLETTNPSSSSPSTGGEGPGCESTAECAVGNCVDGECLTCVTDDDCWGVIDCVTGATCSEGTCVTDVRPCPIDGCHESWCEELPGGQHICRYSLCEQYDDVVDIELRIVANDFTPSPALDVGGEIRVMGRASCGAVVIVRDVASDELLFLSSSGEGPDPGWAWLREDLTTMANATWEQLLSPLLSVDYVDHGVCPSIFDFCEYVDRASVDVTHVEGEVARVLDGHVGWGPGGYLISPHRLELMQYPTDCENTSVANLDVLVARDACDECPAPDFEPGCADPLDPRPANFIALEFVFLDYFQWDRWDFRCRVVDAWTEPGEQVELEQVRALDCIALFQPDGVVGGPSCHDD